MLRREGWITVQEYCIKQDKSFREANQDVFRCKLKDFFPNRIVDNRIGRMYPTEVLSVFFEQYTKVSKAKKAALFAKYSVMTPDDFGGEWVKFKFQRKKIMTHKSSHNLWREKHCHKKENILQLWDPAKKVGDCVRFINFDGKAWTGIIERIPTPETPLGHLRLGNGYCISFGFDAIMEPGNPGQMSKYKQDWRYFTSERRAGK